MTNEVFYGTPLLRQKAFVEFCSKHNCEKCEASGNGKETCDCRFRWLELPATVNLKPCPFCGAEAQLHVSKKSGVYITCTNCCSAAVTDVEVSSAVATWNHRAPMDL